MTERDDEARIHELMGETARAFRAHDVAALDRVFADDFTFTDPAGPVISKEQWLKDVASGELVIESLVPGPVEFRHLGDKVIVLGSATLRARYSKSDWNGSFRYMGVYAQRDGDWTLVLTSADRGGEA